MWVHQGHCLPPQPLADSLCFCLVVPGGQAPAPAGSRLTSHQILPTWPQLSSIPSPCCLYLPCPRGPSARPASSCCRVHRDLISTLLMLMVPWGPLSSTSFLLCCLHSLTLPWALTSQSVPAIPCQVRSVPRIFIFCCP